MKNLKSDVWYLTLLQWVLIIILLSRVKYRRGQFWVDRLWLS